MSTSNFDFIVIDNNSLNCFIAERMLQNINKDISIHTFLHALEAFEYIQKQPTQAGTKTAVLLDIHMPLMDGFEFMEAFETKLSEAVRNHYLVYILTSSTDMNDKIKSKSFSSVKRFISKPLTFNILTDIIEDLGIGIPAH